jgi:hypothetical protein
MIGHFKSPHDAEETMKIINQLSEKLIDKIEFGENKKRFDNEVSQLLAEINCFIFTPSELEHFLLENSIRIEDNKIILTTEESEVSAFFKLMIEKGAKVEIFSAHDYPDAEFGRGK